jgi:hypothetical protein
MLVALLAVAVPVAATAQSNVAAVADAKPVQALVQRIFDLSKAKQLASAEGQALRSGEMAKAKVTTLGSAAYPDKIVMLTDDMAVVRLPASKEHPDLYLYANRDSAGLWTWNSYRALALTGILFSLRDGLRKKKTLTNDEANTLRNVELTLSSDKALIGWFATHRQDLEKVRIATRTGKPIDSSGKNSASKLLAELGLLGATFEDGVLSVTIGGMVDNEVGFLFAPPNKVPAISSDRYIWIEPIGDDWYLYKTT